MNYVGFLHRHPFATDAYELGFAPGVREDYTYVAEAYPNVELPVVILDNKFRDPDVERYLAQFETHDPSVAIIGDAGTTAEAQALNEIGRTLRAAHPQKTYVIVPKCRAALDLLDDEIVLGYAMGYSDVQAADVADLHAWRGKKVHLLGGSPPQQYEIIEALTQPTLTDDPPADIVGMDWNGVQKVAYLGEFWSRNGWQPADHLSIRETVRTSLEEIKQFWQARGVWPETEPIDLYGPAVQEPVEPVYAVDGGDITTRRELERAIVGDYDDRGPLAYRDATTRAFYEWREGL